MSFYQNISFGGYNPFMAGCFNPRLNFFLGLASGTAGIPCYPVMPSLCGYSIFNSYMPMAYVNNYSMGGFGGYGSGIPTPQTFTYIPQTTTSAPTTTAPTTTASTTITNNNPFWAESLNEKTSSENKSCQRVKEDNSKEQSNRKVKSQGLNLIKSFESCSLKACKAVSTEKQYSIGWGHYGVPQGTVWSQQQADEQLVKDLAKCEKYVNGLGRKWTQNQFDALVSFTYNCGPKNLFSLVKNRNDEEIAQAMLLYNKSGGNVLRGLTRRRQAERDMFLGDSSKNNLNSIA